MTLEQTPDPGIGLVRIHYERTGSTNDRAREALAEHPGRLVVVTAREQTAGRGRQGRAWVSAEGGAWLSIAGPVRSVVESPKLVLAAALAAAGTIDESVDRQGAVRIRWPNDLLLGDRKIGGLLGEGAEVGGRPVLVLGVGINVNNEVGVPPVGEAAFRTPPTTVALESGGPVELDVFVNRLVGVLSDAWRWFGRHGFDAIACERFDKRLAYRGEHVRLESGTRTVEGRLLGVDPDGSLRLEVQGHIERFHTGELSVRPA